MMKPRSKSARDLMQAAKMLGYSAGRTATGHLRFVHQISGRIVVTPSKTGGRAERNAYAELARNQEERK